MRGDKMEVPEASGAGAGAVVGVAGAGNKVHVTEVNEEVVVSVGVGADGVSMILTVFFEGS